MSEVVFQPVEATWNAYRTWVRRLGLRFGATAWAACLERSEHAAQAGERIHGHVYLLWEDGAGIHLENLEPLEFEGVRPRVDRCVQVANGKCLRTAALHGYWYVTVSKAGTLHADSSWKPWKDYQPLVCWLTGLWDAGKLSHKEYEALSCDFRGGHAKRVRDIQEVERTERERAVSALVAQELAALEDSNALLPFRHFPEVDRFIQSFTQKLWRRPVLVIVGGTNMGKSILAAHVLTEIGKVLSLPSFLEVTVENDEVLDVSEMDVRLHSGVLLDGGVREVIVL